MELVIGIVGSIIAAAIVGVVVGAWRQWQGRKIAITDPEENGYLGPVERINGVMAHPVRGTLKYLPKNHRIWLLVVDEAKGKVWPQGFTPVVPDRSKGTWKGYVHVWGWKDVTLVAVVAPPTSHDYFTYFQLMGTDFNSGYPPLTRIPEECKQQQKILAKVPRV